MPEASTEAIQPPHHERVADSEVVQAGLELRAPAQRSGADVVVDPLAADALECVEL